MSAIERVPSRDLDTLAAEIRHQFEQAEADFESAVAHVLCAGQLLIDAKSQVRHGEWLRWLSTNFPASVDTAETWMRLARNSERVRNSLSIRDALKQIAASSEIITEGEVVPDHCPRCERIVRSDGPHKCKATSRRLSEAHVALQRALIDLRRYPPSTYPRPSSDDEMAATVLHLAGQVKHVLSGSPELDELTERRRKSEGVQRRVEGVGKAACKDCGTTLVEYKGRPYCYACESYKDGQR